MGKLHKLRRAIAREPDRFMYESLPFRFENYRPVPTQTHFLCYGAGFREGRWQPVICHGDHSWPYRRFVRSVLRSLGYDIR